MAGAVHEVKGGRQLRKTLKEAGEDLGDLKDVHKRAAEVAATRVRARAPEVSGRLKATVRAAGTRTAGIVRVGNNTKVPYANPIQWGWYRRHIKPNPFATTGAAESEPSWRPLYEQFVETTLNKIEGA